MNIWIFNHYALPPIYPGGTRHFDLSKELVKKGHRVKIFASSFLYSRLKETQEYGKEEVYKLENYDGVEFVWIKTVPYTQNDFRRFYNMLSYCKNVKKAVSSLHDKPDIIIGSSVHLFAVNTAFNISRKLKVPFVMEVRDLWPQTLIDLGMSKFHPFVLLLGYLEKKLYSKALKIITLLPKSAEFIASKGVPNSKIEWIPNGISLEKFENLLDNYPSNKIFTLSYTGAIGKANNLQVVLEAAKLLKEEKVLFRIVGEGPERENLIKFKEENNLNNVEILPPVPKSEVIDILKSSDALIFNLEDSPVFKYGISSNKLFDYLAAARPIIFSAKASNNPVDEARAGITVPPNSPEEFSKAVLKLKNMTKEELREMGKRGFDYVKENHSIEKLSVKLEELLKKTIENYA
jgi:glycosyltransferase involved in cell wall biosynthesis